MSTSRLKSFFLVLICSGFFACSDSTNEPQPSIRITTLTPPVSLTGSSFQDLQGRPVEISDYPGKKVLLNYWATWCAPCIREIPSLFRAAEQFENDEFVLLLASDESLEDIIEFVSDHEFKGNFLKLNSFFSSYGVEAIPSTMLFNGNGEIINSWLGEYEWDSDEILSELRESN